MKVRASSLVTASDALRVVLKAQINSEGEFYDQH